MGPRRLLQRLDADGPRCGIDFLLRCSGVGGDRMPVHRRQTKSHDGNDGERHTHVLTPNDLLHDARRSGNGIDVAASSAISPSVPESYSMLNRLWPDSVLRGAGDQIRNETS